MKSLRSLLALCVVGIVGALGAGVATAAGPPAVRELVGTLRLTPGSCAQGRPAGSYLAVTFGTRAIRNSSSGCADGAFTLLSPGPTGLSTRRFSPSISAPARFDNKVLSLGTASQNIYAPPRIYLIGNRVESDVRSMQVGYNGGEWSIGAERATGTYHPRSHRLELQWFSGQSFTSASAGTEVRLVGRFVGVARSLPKGTTVNLGTASFAAGNPHAVVRTVADTSSRGSKNSRFTRGRDTRQALGLAANSQSTSTGSPRTFLIAELVVLLNIVAYVALARRRGRK